MSEIIKGRISSYIYKSEDSLYKIAKIISNNDVSLKSVDKEDLLGYDAYIEEVK